MDQPWWLASATFLETAYLFNGGQPFTCSEAVNQTDSWTSSSRSYASAASNPSQLMPWTLLLDDSSCFGQLTSCLHHHGCSASWWFRKSGCNQRMPRVRLLDAHFIPGWSEASRDKNSCAAVEEAYQVDRQPYQRHCSLMQRIYRRLTNWWTSCALFPRSWSSCWSEFYFWNGGPFSIIRYPGATLDSHSYLSYKL